MATINDKELEDLLGKCSAWLPKAMEQVGCAAPVDVTSGLCKRSVMKDTLALLFINLLLSRIISHDSRWRS